MGDYRPRIADQQVGTCLAALGAVVVEGAKACGKTATAGQHAASEVLLDTDQAAAEAAALDPALVLAGPTPRLIDEWQRIPPVWDAVRRAVDERGRTGQFILTGSSTPADDVPRHSGAGRMATVWMRPMTLFEQGFSPGSFSLGGLLRGDPQEGGATPLRLLDYIDRVIAGGWPGLLDSWERAPVFLRGYLDMIIEHDIDVVSGARRNPRLVRRFLHAYAQLSAHPCPLSTIVQRAAGDDGGPARWTADPYLDALRRMMIIDEVPAWDPELRSRSRLVSVPKRHLVDPSLAAALMGADERRLHDDLRTLGFLFESLVTRDLRVYADLSEASVFHYRERAGLLEVDLVVEALDGTWVGVEVKLGDDRAIENAAKTLRRLNEDRVARPAAGLLVVTAGGYCYQRPDGVWIVPLGLLGP